jgi:inhibitor of cysteine peptidase
MSGLKISVLVLIAAATVLFGIAGCRSTDHLDLDAGSEGSRVEVAVGQTLVVTLDANPTTGYGWGWVPSEDGVLQQVGETEFQQGAVAQDLVGVGGQEILRFKAEKVGQTVLELVYRRPWEKDANPEGTFSVEVVVR